MKLLINIILTGLAVAIADYIIPGVSISSFWVALLVVIVMGIINVTLRPILLLLTLPFNIITLGLFTFVINALMILLAAKIVTGFIVEGFWDALLFSLIVSFIKMLVNRLEKTPAK